MDEEIDLYDYALADVIPDEDEAGRKGAAKIETSENLTEKYAAKIRKLIIGSRSTIMRLKRENEELKVNLKNAVESSGIAICPNCTHHFKDRACSMKPNRMKTFRANKCVEIEFNTVDDLNTWLYLNQLETNTDGMPTILKDAKNKEVERFTTLKSVGSLIPTLLADSKDRGKDRKRRMDEDVARIDKKRKKEVIRIGIRKEEGDDEKKAPSKAEGRKEVRELPQNKSKLSEERKVSEKSGERRIKEHRALPQAVHIEKVKEAEKRRDHSKRISEGSRTEDPRRSSRDRTPKKKEDEGKRRSVASRISFVGTSGGGELEPRVPVAKSSSERDVQNSKSRICSRLTLPIPKTEEPIEKPQRPETLSKAEENKKEGFKLPTRKNGWKPTKVLKEERKEGGLQKLGNIGNKMAEKEVVKKIEMSNEGKENTPIDEMKGIRENESRKLEKVGLELSQQFEPIEKLPKEITTEVYRNVLRISNGDVSEGQTQSQEPYQTEKEEVEGIQCTSVTGEGIQCTRPSNGDISQTPIQNKVLEPEDWQEILERRRMNIVKNLPSPEFVFPKVVETLKEKEVKRQQPPRRKITFDEEEREAPPTSRSEFKVPSLKKRLSNEQDPFFEFFPNVKADELFGKGENKEEEEDDMSYWLSGDTEVEAGDLKDGDVGIVSENEDNEENEASDDEFDELDEEEEVEEPIDEPHPEISKSPAKNGLKDEEQEELDWGFDDEELVGKGLEVVGNEEKEGEEEEAEIGKDDEIEDGEICTDDEGEEKVSAEPIISSKNESKMDNKKRGYRQSQQVVESFSKNENTSQRRRRRSSDENIRIEQNNVKHHHHHQHDERRLLKRRN